MSLEDKENLFQTKAVTNYAYLYAVHASAWYTQVDMQYIVSRCRVDQYCTKYVTMGEPQSKCFQSLLRSVWTISYCVYISECALTIDFRFWFMNIVYNRSQLVTQRKMKDGWWDGKHQRMNYQMALLRE